MLPCGLRFVNADVLAFQLGLTAADAMATAAALRRALRLRRESNSNLLHPFRLVALYEQGQCILQQKPLPEWLEITQGDPHQ